MGHSDEQRHHTAESFRPGASKPHKSWRPKAKERLFIGKPNGNEAIRIYFQEEGGITIAVQNPSGGTLIVTQDGSQVTIQRPHSKVAVVI